MDCKIEIIPRLLHFKQPAGTSRGVYTTRKVWYLHLTSPDYPGRTGIGECAPLPALSCDDLPDYENILAGGLPAAGTVRGRTGYGCLARLSVHPVRIGNGVPSSPDGQLGIVRYGLLARKGGDSDKRAYLDGRL